MVRENVIGQLLALSLYVQIKLSLESQIQSSMKGQPSSAADAFLAFMQQALTPVQGQPNLKQSFVGASLFKTAQKDSNVAAESKAQAFSKRKQVPGAVQSDVLIGAQLMLDPKTTPIQTPILSAVSAEPVFPIATDIAPKTGAVLGSVTSTGNTSSRATAAFTSANVWQAPANALNSAAKWSNVAATTFIANTSTENAPAQNDRLQTSVESSDNVVPNNAPTVAPVSTDVNFAVQKEGQNVAPVPNGAVTAEKIPQIDFSEISNKASLTEDVSKEVVRPETSSINEIKARDLASAQSAAVNTGGISKIDVSEPSIQASLMEDVRNHGGQVEILRTKSSWVQSAGTVNLRSITDSNSAHRRYGDASAAQEPISEALASNSKVVAPVADVLLDGASANASNTVPVIPVSVQEANDASEEESAATTRMPGTAVRPAAHLSHDSLKAVVNAQLSGEMSHSLPPSAKQSLNTVRPGVPNGAMKPRAANATTTPSHTSAKAKFDSAQPKTDSLPSSAANNSSAEEAPTVSTERHETAAPAASPALQEAAATVYASRGPAFGNGREHDPADVARAQVLADAPTLDSKTVPATHPVGSVQAARLVQTLRESQLQVGLHAGEFGKISIHTSMDQNHIAARIYVEHEELGKVIAGSLPELHEKLEVHHRLDAQVELYNTGSDQSDKQQHEQYQRTTQNFRIDRDSSDPEPQVDTPQQLQSVATTVGLDMHV